MKTLLLMILGLLAVVGFFIVIILSISSLIEMSLSCPTVLTIVISLVGYHMFFRTDSKKA